MARRPTKNQRRGVVPTVRRGPKVPAHRFTAETFDALAEDLRTKRLPLPKVTITDDVIVGLRAVIRETGLVSYHVSYNIDDSRPLLKLGNHPEMDVSTARKLASTVLSLSDRGIDPQDGLHVRLIRELLEEGADWRPK